MTTRELLEQYGGDILLPDGTTEPRRHRVVPNELILVGWRDAIDVTGTGDAEDRYVLGDGHWALVVPLPFRLTARWLLFWMWLVRGRQPHRIKIGKVEADNG